MEISTSGNLNNTLRAEDGTQEGRTSTPTGEAEAERLAEPQREEESPSRNPPNNVTATRSLLVTEPLVPED
ncbi:hypothetical protein ACLOJK_023463 [Asimina triloba]